MEKETKVERELATKILSKGLKIQGRTFMQIAEQLWLNLSIVQMTVSILRLSTLDLLLFFFLTVSISIAMCRMTPPSQVSRMGLQRRRLR